MTTMSNDRSKSKTLRMVLGSTVNQRSMDLQGIGLGFFTHGNQKDQWKKKVHRARSQGAGQMGSGSERGPGGCLVEISTRSPVETAKKSTNRAKYRRMCFDSMLQLADPHKSPPMATSLLPRCRDRLGGRPVLRMLTSPVSGFQSVLGVEKHTHN